MVDRRTKLRRAPLILLAAVCLLSQVAEGADTFYLDLLRDGTRSYERGDLEDAVKSLRIACFGFLDEPALLTEGIARLALAQARMADQDGFEASFRRLVEIEEKVGGYSQTELPKPLKSELERELIARIPPAELAGSPAFVRLAEIARAPTPVDPGADRRDLVRRSKETPGEPGVLLRLAELDLQAGQPKQSLKWLNKLDPAGAQTPEARCLRGRALLELGDCRPALAELATCPSFSPPTSPAAVDYLACLVKVKDWAAADRLLADLPAAATADPRTGRLASRVARARSGSEPPAASRRAERQPLPDPARSAQEPARDQRELDDLRSRLGNATSVEDLGELLDRARGIAAADPTWSEARFLAGEIAYHAAMWREAAELFQEGGEPGSDRPDLRFYLAVSLYESGDAEGAARVLDDALPYLERSSFVDEYAAKILSRGRGEP